MGKIEYGSGTRRVGIYAQQYTDGRWAGRVSVADHRPGGVDQRVDEIDGPFDTEDAALEAAGDYARRTFPPTQHG